jgi:hypothetical protein
MRFQHSQQVTGKYFRPLQPRLPWLGIDRREKSKARRAIGFSGTNVVKKARIFLRQYQFLRTGAV